MGWMYGKVIVFIQVVDRDKGSGESVNCPDCRFLLPDWRGCRLFALGVEMGERESWKNVYSTSVSRLDWISVIALEFD